MIKELLAMFATKCGDVETSLIECGENENGISTILVTAVDVLSIGIGAAAIAGIVISGIQYSAAAGDPAAVTKAKRRLIEILLGLLAYGVFYVFLRWLIPNF